MNIRDVGWDVIIKDIFNKVLGNKSMLPIEFINVLKREYDKNAGISDEKYNELKTFSFIVSQNILPSEDLGLKFSKNEKQLIDDNLHKVVLDDSHLYAVLLEAYENAYRLRCMPSPSPYF
ncbi:hypothetical protein ACSVDE_10970 [Pseudalkalibacillus sp. Hm43]|uniref:hypothetical protein n=1 Tax=Pseudalkalibacillus sp. Hm43 TaxID=3450742 RepID=UPI003F43CA83